MVIKRTKPARAIPAPAVEAPKAKSYLALQAWNLFLRGPRMYGVTRAQETDAPDDAIFWRNEGGWACKSALDVMPDHPFHAFYAKFVKEQTSS